jgi:colanic acid biosynthesis protein WcaH
MFIPEEEYLKIQAVLPILCVDCLVIYDKKCLLLRRIKEPAKGQYWFPGGRVFKGETFRDASLRKAREEVNLDCRYEEVISIEETIFEQQGDMLSDIHTVNICCHLSTQELNNLFIDASHDAFIWVNFEQAKNLNLHFAVFSPLWKCRHLLT